MTISWKQKNTPQRRFHDHISIPKKDTYIYIMTGRAIRGNEVDRIGPTEGRDDTEVENGIFLGITRPEELQ